MNFVNINEKRPEYSFLDRYCIGRRCWHATQLGCNNRRLHGCPDPLPPYEKEREQSNRAKGWKPAPR